MEVNAPNAPLPSKTWSTLEAPAGAMSHSLWWRSLGVAAAVHLALVVVWGWMSWDMRQASGTGFDEGAVHWVDWWPEPHTQSMDPVRVQADGVSDKPTPPLAAAAEAPQSSNLESASVPAEVARPQLTQDHVALGPKAAEPASSDGPAADVSTMNVAEVAAAAANQNDSRMPLNAPLAPPKQERETGATQQIQAPESEGPPGPRLAQAMVAERLSLSWVRDNLVPVYPRTSRRLGEEGTVELQLTFGDDAQLLAAAVSRSSGFARLDRAALRATQNWRYPDGLPRHLRGQVVRVPVVFSLAAAAPSRP